MFWINDKAERPSIESAWMDGSHRQTLVTEQLSHPSGITVDYLMGNRIFWVDDKKGTIESMKPDGTDRVTVIKGINHPVRLDVLGKFLFWLSKDTGKLTQMIKFGGSYNRTLMTGISFGTDVVVMHQYKISHKLKNNCTLLKCEFMCALTPSSGRCLCPHNAAMDDANKCTAAHELPLAAPGPCHCDNGGYCEKSSDDDDETILCFCPTGFSGKRCEKNDIKAREKLRSTAAAAIVVPILLLIIVAVAGVLGYLYIKRKQNGEKPLLKLPFNVTMPENMREYVHDWWKKWTDKVQFKKSDGAVAFHGGTDVDIDTPGFLETGEKAESLDDFPITDTDNFANPIYQVMMSLEKDGAADAPQHTSTPVALPRHSAVSPVRPPRGKAKPEYDDTLDERDNVVLEADTEILVENVDL